MVGNNELIVAPLLLILFPGDFLILDNARIHYAQDTLPALSAMLAQNGVTLIYLPPYSPELQVCELLFAFLKAYLQRHSPTSDLFVALITALAKITSEHVRKCIYHCVWVAWKRV